MKCDETLITIAIIQVETLMAGLLYYALAGHKVKQRDAFLLGQYYKHPLYC